MQADDNRTFLDALLEHHAARLSALIHACLLQGEKGYAVAKVKKKLKKTDTIPKSQLKAATNAVLRLLLQDERIIAKDSKLVLSGKGTRVATGVNASAPDLWHHLAAQTASGPMSLANVRYHLKKRGLNMPIENAIAKLLAFGCFYKRNGKDNESEVAIDPQHFSRPVSSFPNLSFLRRYAFAAKKHETTEQSKKLSAPKAPAAPQTTRPVATTNPQPATKANATEKKASVPTIPPALRLYDALLIDHAARLAVAVHTALQNGDIFPKANVTSRLERTTFVRPEKLVAAVNTVLAFLARDHNIKVINEHLVVPSGTPYLPPMPQGAPLPTAPKALVRALVERFVTLALEGPRTTVAWED
ncbi:hypothetical protein ACHHYP_08525 [Achlya hypogyna]|uniref:Uncharacterized protein n=1 Tax=Achlya hypogyna TaxID=1202772 RepID=A0A1V9YP61_ACHHY|nr:hypothetical protein ACHHYP_08525 [Achlya hypogyna]